MTLSRVTERAKEVAKEPSRQWKNRWGLANDGVYWGACRHCGGSHRIPGTGDAWGCRTYPSRELAEQWASEYHNENVVHLGAFPIGPA